LGEGYKDAPEGEGTVLIFSFPCSAWECIVLKNTPSLLPNLNVFIDALFSFKEIFI
jgi:hypothetical protein